MEDRPSVLPLELRLRIATTSVEAWRTMIRADPEVARVSLDPNVQRRARESFSRVETTVLSGGSVRETTTYPDSSGTIAHYDGKGRLRVRQTFGSQGESSFEFFDKHAQTQTPRTKIVRDGKQNLVRVEIFDENGNVSSYTRRATATTFLRWWIPPLVCVALATALILSRSTKA